MKQKIQRGISVVFVIFFVSILAIVFIGNLYFKQVAAEKVAAQEKINTEEARRVREAEELKRLQNSTMAKKANEAEVQTQQRPVDGSGDNSEWIELVCYEKESVLPMVQPDKGRLFSFQEKGDVVVMTPGSPDELRCPAKIGQNLIVFSNPKSENGVYTIDRISGVIRYESKGLLVMRGVCVLGRNRRF
ncbi:MAG: hypothetical protein PHU46_06860 [Rhodocyclaceae bacterium]|nr:hypothetical protein [Rhodocyclaceae bacterium]